jgi:glutamate--cysteine ligase
MGDSEVGFLRPLLDIVADGKTSADRLLERFNGEWQGDIARVYQEKSF